MADSAARLRRPAALQSRAIGGHHGDSRRGVLGLRRRPPAGVFHGERTHHLGLRHRSRVQDRERRPGHGGAIDVAGPVVAGGMLFSVSGYPARGGMGGNVLLAFGVE